MIISPKRKPLNVTVLRCYGVTVLRRYGKCNCVTASQRQSLRQCKKANATVQLCNCVTASQCFVL